MRKFPRLAKQVEAVLRDKPHTRNLQDVDLTLWVWYEFYNEFLEWQPDELLPEKGRWMVSMTSIKALPREDMISRMRRKFQEQTDEYPQGKYPPTDPSVIKKRRHREREVRYGITTQDWQHNL